MKAGNGSRISSGLAAAAVMTVIFMASQFALAGPQSKTPKGKIFAQKLVESTQAKHPEADEIGISTTTERGCYGIASTDKGDIGEECDNDDMEPMHTLKPFVEKERDGFDVSLPLRDAQGKLIGAVGIGFKPASGQTEASVTREAQKIATEMEARIPSKAALFARS
jgi:hypothetical protein